MEWTDQVAVVTGGGRGIGAATVRLLNSLGAKVLMTARSESELRTVQEGCKNPANVRWLAGDISNPDHCRRLFSEVKRIWGPVTTLFNNAATLSVASFPEISEVDLHVTLAVNVVAPFLCSQLAFADMAAAGKGGAIINVSSLAGIVGTDKFPGFSSYCVSKFALVGLTEASAVEGRPLGIRVNCIAPGAVETRMLRDNAPHLKTNTHPEDIAKLVAFLADPNQSGALTGSIIPVMSNIT